MSQRGSACTPLVGLEGFRQEPSAREMSSAVPLHMTVGWTSLVVDCNLDYPYANVWSSIEIYKRWHRAVDILTTEIPCTCFVRADAGWSTIVTLISAAEAEMLIRFHVSDQSYFACCVATGLALQPTYPYLPNSFHSSV